MSIDDLIQQCDDDAARYLREVKTLRANCHAQRRQLYLGQHRYASVMANRLREFQASAEQAQDLPASD